MRYLVSLCLIASLGCGAAPSKAQVAAVGKPGVVDERADLDKRYDELKGKTDKNRNLFKQRFNEWSADKSPGKKREEKEVEIRALLFDLARDYKQIEHLLKDRIATVGPRAGDSEKLHQARENGYLVIQNIGRDFDQLVRLQETLDKTQTPSKP